MHIYQAYITHLPLPIRLEGVDSKPQFVNHTKSYSVRDPPRYRLRGSRLPSHCANRVVIRKTSLKYLKDIEGKVGKI
ncbi:hypothetical protein SFRURICE_016668 [Spodoptera frugiperda]|nr:hypothetical protein SFRURICE_016668 [Spodoptera frugiperda]